MSGASAMSASPARVRRAAAELLRSLGVTPPLDVEDICRRLGEQRGRPIHPMAHSFPDAAAVGLWLSTTSADLILYECGAPPAHQRHIVLHELGHVFFDHGDDGADDSIWSELTPTLNPDVVRRALRRCGYDTAAEHEAELFASIVSTWSTTVGPAGSGPVSHLEHALDDPRGWW